MIRNVQNEDRVRVGILSRYYHNWNFGGLLQAYALCRELQVLGYAAEQIAHSDIAPNHKGGILPRWLLTFLGKGGMRRDILDRSYLLLNHDRRNLKRFRQFETNEIAHGKYIGGAKEITQTIAYYDCFVAGSDQIWNASYYSDEVLRMYGLCFAKSSKRKVAYAASMGAEKAAAGKEGVFREILDNLDYISVREESARAYLQPLTDKPVTVVLDPTLLLERQTWKEMAVGQAEESPYLFTYFLNEAGNHHDKQLHKIAEAMELPLYCITEELGCYPRPDSGDRQILDAGPKEFVGYIRDAEMVLTNSFHGVVFSVLFHKPFWAFKRNKDDEKASMNGRVIDFLNNFGLLDRLLEDGEIPPKEKLIQPIDYERVDRILEEKRAFSLKWLKNALDGI